MIKGLSIEFRKVASFKYVRLVHVESGELLFNWIRFTSSQRDLKNIVLNKLGLLDWNISADNISKSEQYYNSVLNLKLSIA